MARRDAEEAQLETLTRAAAESVGELLDGDGRAGTARLLDLARAQSAAGDALGALTSYRAVAMRDPRSVVAHAGAAREALEYAMEPASPESRQLRIDIALEYASRAIAIDPQSALAHSALARVLPERSRADRGGRRGAAMQAILEGFAHARRAIELDPDDADALDFVAARVAEWRHVGGMARMAARALLGAGELDATTVPQAAEFARRAVALDPECLRYRLTLSRLLALLGDDRGAQEQFQIIRDAAPARPSEIVVQESVRAMR